MAQEQILALGQKKIVKFYEYKAICPLNIHI